METTHQAQCLEKNMERERGGGIAKERRPRKDATNA